MLMDIGMSLFQQRVPAVSRYVEGLPVVLLEHGEPIMERMNKARVSKSDRLEDGSISIIPESS